MPQNRWGDGYALIASPKKEPYRLWFEWLKLAIRDEEVFEHARAPVERSREGWDKLQNELRKWGPQPPWWSVFYSQWLPSEENQRWTELRPQGMENLTWKDFGAIPFEPWFEAHWRELFSVNFPVVSLEAGQVVTNGGNYPRAITLQIPIMGNKEFTIEQVVKILQETKWKDNEYFLEEDNYRLPAGLWAARMAEFGLTYGFEQGIMKRLPETRRYLRLYELWLNHAEAKSRARFDLAVSDFVIWHRQVGAAATESVGPLPETYVLYADFLKKRGESGKKLSLETEVKFEENGRVITAEDCSIAIHTDLAKARKIAKNLVNGEFPGKYNNV